MKKKIISAILMSTVVLSAAAPLSGVYADTNSDIAKQDATISSAQSAKAQAQAQVDSLQSKVDSLQQKQTSTKAQIAKIESEAKALNAQIATLNESIKERTKTLEAQARSAQVNSSATNYMDTVVNSKSLTDVIQKVTAIATVSSANKQMLEQQEKEQKELSQKSETVKKNYNQFVSLSQSLDSQAQELTSQQAELKVATLNYQATIATAQDKKQALLDEKAAAEKAAQEAAKKQAAYEAQQKEAAQAQAASTAATAKAVEAATSSASASSSQAQASQSSSSTSSNNTSSSSSSSTSSSSSSSNNDTTPTPTPTPTPPSTGGSGINSSPIGNPYAGGGCTDYVWQYFAAQGIYIRNIMPGNGGQWASNGPAQGVLHVVGAAPGVIVSSFSADFVGYANSPYGHVAIVKSVNSDGTITIKEGGYGTTWWGHERTVSASGVTFLMPN
ncbi:CHAP domain-containing protein [Lactococcus cremoris]|uniref:CHAP domain-containing protein n=1 Tax=Lactococcus lactis subsp. cremoris TaxID=1359 RepID=UPI00077B904C|nr:MULTISPECIES: CHAP domain-containing protein [Lactococcus]AXN66515.1 Surface antigen [Lactococcus cremoris]MRM50427.1 CHAP domain-containing protein [Lactococcus cremoris]OAJ97667.1 CHAP domain-containing protein [Lactococcus lactis]PFG90865.1 CHAP domain-containing protein [Lactococcus cremoris]